MLYSREIINKHDRVFINIMLFSFVTAFAVMTILGIIQIIKPVNKGFAFLYLTMGFHFILTSLICSRIGNKDNDNQDNESKLNSGSGDNHVK